MRRGSRRRRARTPSAAAKRLCFGGSAADGARHAGRSYSRRVPERVTKRVGRADRWNAERDQEIGPAVWDDDLGLSAVAIPLEPHRETVAVSRVELNEHRALPGRSTAKTRAP